MGSGYSDEFGVKVGVYQGSVLSPILFIIVLEALSRLCSAQAALAAETWAMSVATLNRLWRNDHAMLGWICNVKANDAINTDSLLARIGLQDIDVVLRASRMRWYGHVE